jgi:hypothetical protein
VNKKGKRDNKSAHIAKTTYSQPKAFWISLSLILFLLIGAHYYLFGNVGAYIWDITHTIGSDIPFTPFTADMFASGGETINFDAYDLNHKNLNENEEQNTQLAQESEQTSQKINAFYTQNISFEIITITNNHTYDITTFSFYQFKLPLQHYVQAHAMGYNRTKHTYALCYFAKQMNPAAIGFQINIGEKSTTENEKKKKSIPGINTPVYCIT